LEFVFQDLRTQGTNEGVDHLVDIEGINFVDQDATIPLFSKWGESKAAGTPATVTWGNMGDERRRFVAVQYIRHDMGRF
jgi:hypothetical protein